MSAPDRFLVDTHTFLWWTLGRPGLSPMAHSVLREPSNELVLSAATAWEMLIKYKLGKLSLDDQLAENISGAARALGFQLLSIRFEHAQQTARLPQFKDHRDPFDRILIGQAMVEGLTLLSNESIYDRYGVTRVW